MGRIVLVTGGSRSGKSAYAQHLAERLPGRRAYIATCQVIDDELHERVRKHRDFRAAESWDTIEETVDIARVIREAKGYDVLLLDCLTLWVNNLMYEAENKDGCATGTEMPSPASGRESVSRSIGQSVSEDDVAELCAEVIAACRETESTTIFVTNEVGMGIVPDNLASRLYRDLVGRCNQTIAAVADDVILVTCGIPLYIKRRSKDT